MAEMAKWLGDDATATKVMNQYTLGRSEFPGRFFTTSFCTGTPKSEGDIAGYSWARYFCLPAIFDSNVVATGCTRLKSYYSPLSGRARLGQWHFYTYDHWGGAAIAIGRPDDAMDVNKWDYDYYYTGNPSYVHWQDLNSTNSTYASYMTGPCVWHGMFQMCGYLLDNAFHRLWIRPMVPTTMNKQITKAPLINPRGWGTLDYDENPTASQRCQNITVTFDSLTRVDTLMLKNNTGLSTFPANYIAITNGGAAVTGFTATTGGSAFEKNIKIAFAAPIQIGPQGGVNIQVFTQPLTVSGTIIPGLRPDLKLHGGKISAGKPFTFAVAASGHATLELVSLSGAKIATIFNGSVATGSHTAVWNGFSGNRSIGYGIAILRLNSPTGIITRAVRIER